jgi:ribonuclease inhibitor
MLIILDGKDMETKESTHKLFKKAFNFPDYYGNNLDALFDMLICISEPLTIDIINKEAIELHLKAYGRNVLKTFLDAGNENPCIELNIMSSHSD